MHKTNAQYQTNNKTSAATKYGSCILLFLAVIFISNIVLSATKNETNWLDETISINFQNEPLSKVLKQISEQTGVSIAYDQELANEKVTGNFEHIKTSDAITRLFRSKNKSIQVNEEKKIILIKTFGAKNFVWAGASVKSQNKSSQMTLATLERMHAQQYKEYKEYISKDTEMLEDGSMTRGELRKMHNGQLQDILKNIDNAAETLEDGSMTRGELRALHDQQLKTLQNQIANDASVAQTNLRTMHEQQTKNYQKIRSNVSEMLDDKNMTFGELRALHERQLKEYKENESNRSIVFE